MQHADDCWVKISPAQRAGAYEMYGIGCTGHSLNLSTKVSHKKSESTVISASMVYDRASRVMLRYFLGGYRRRNAGEGPEIPAHAGHANYVDSQTGTAARATSAATFLTIALRMLRRCPCDFV